MDDSRTQHSRAQRRRQEIFKQTPANSFSLSLGGSLDASSDPATPLSLRSYIRQRIREQREPPLQKPSALPDQPPKTTAGGFVSAFRQSFGDQLYGLDTELSSGIEQYLPTPAIRLRVIKERLRREIVDLEEHLAKYRNIRIPSPALRAKIHRLGRKLKTLKTHEARVDRDLTDLFSRTSDVFPLSNALQQARHRISEGLDRLLEGMAIEKLLRQIDPDRDALNALNLQLRDLTEVLQVQRGRRALSADEISDIVNQYDQTVRRIDTLAETLRNQPGPFRMRRPPQKS